MESKCVQTPLQVLLQQVEEQSSVCDVTIKVRDWEKKFHWCVLLGCPFFACIYRNNYIEKITGTISLESEYPSAVEEAILFVYGKELVLTIDTISDVIHMAEFLQIPNLKSACIRWMEKETLTHEICLLFIYLSNLYDFKLTNCWEYVLKHLKEVLQNEDSLWFSLDQVQYGFSMCCTDYFPMKERLCFIERWIQFQPERKKHFKELIVNIDLDDINSTDLERLKRDPYIATIDCDVFDCAPAPNIRVLLSKDRSNDHQYVAYNFADEKWYKMVRKCNVNNFMAIDVGKNSTSNMFFLEKEFGTCSLITFNLASDTITKSSLLDENARNKLENISCVTVINDKVYAIANSLIVIHSKDGIQTIFESTLFQGRLKVHDIAMVPVLTFKQYYASVLCSNTNLGAIAIGSEQLDTLYIYDLITMRIKKVDVGHAKHESDRSVTSKSKLLAMDNGFIIQNKMWVIRIKHGKCQNEYTVDLHELENLSQILGEFGETKYYYCGDCCYRYKCVTINRKKIKFEYTMFLEDDDKLKARNWRSLPSPTKSVTLDDQMMMLTLPKSKLNCPLQCHHCLELAIDSDDDMSEDDDNDDWDMDYDVESDSFFEDSDDILLQDDSSDDSNW